MPEYVYRRQDGTTFTLKQKFNDDPLMVDPETGQKVVRVVQNSGVIFKGSGFYVNDSKDASKKNLSTPTPNTEEKGLAKKEDASIVKKEDKPKDIVKKEASKV